MIINEMSSPTNNLLPVSRLPYNALNTFSRPDITKNAQYHPIATDMAATIESGYLENEANKTGNSISKSNERVLISPTISVVSLSLESVEKNIQDNNSLKLKSKSSTKLTENGTSSFRAHKTKTGKTRENSSKQLRRGKWTIEEEEYVARIINSFNIGYLDAPAGTTLRSYLSEKLRCDPMRITKKFTGESCIGKRIFHPAIRCRENCEAIDKEQATVKSLEVRWLNKVDSMIQNSSRKSVISDTIPMVSSTNSSMDINVMRRQRASSNNNHIQFAATYAASWLDRATDLLSTNPPQDVTMSVVHSTEVEQQLNAVRKLIYEAPIIPNITQNSPTSLKSNQNYKYSDNMSSSSKTELQQKFMSVHAEKPFLKSQEFGSELFPNFGYSEPLKNSISRPLKKPRKSYSTNHLSTISDKEFLRKRKASSSCSLKDAEVLMDFVRSARENQTVRKNSIWTRRHSYA